MTSQATSPQDTTSTEATSTETAVDGASQPAVGAPPRGAGALLIVVGACFLMVMMDNTILNVALQAIQRDLNATTSQLQWAVDSYILVYAALMFTAGVIADRWGRRRTLAVGLILFAIASTFAALATSPEQLILWRGLMGVGGAVVPPATLAIIKNGIPVERQGAAMGVWSAIGGLSVAFGPIIGGALLERFAWGSVFLVNVPIAVICAVLLFVVAPESRSGTPSRLDLPGIALSMAAIGSLVYGVIRAGEVNDWFALDSGGMIALGVALIVVLVLVERRTRFPALDVSLFRSRAFSAGTTAISAAFFALTGGTFLLVFLVQLVLGYSPLQLGLILLPVAVGSVATAISSAAAVRRLGYRVVVPLALGLLIVSLAGMLAVTRTTPLVLLEATLLGAGLGMGLAMGSTTTLVMSAVPAEKAAVGSAVNNTLRQVGAALGVAAMGSVLSAQYRDAVLPQLAGVPAAIRDLAADSLGASVVVLDRMRPALGEQRYTALLTEARDAFVGAMHTTLLVGIGVLAVGAVIALLWVPSRRAAAGTPGHGASR